jgi:hypothetical protein
MNKYKIDKAGLLDGLAAWDSFLKEHFVRMAKKEGLYREKS